MRDFVHFALIAATVFVLFVFPLSAPSYVPMLYDMAKNAVTHVIAYNLPVP